MQGGNSQGVVRDTIQERAALDSPSPELQLMDNHLENLMGVLSNVDYKLKRRNNFRVKWY